MKWDEWRGSMDGRPSMFIKRLVDAFGWRVDLHKIVRADDLDCFHTHPAKRKIPFCQSAKGLTPQKPKLETCVLWGLQKLSAPAATKEQNHEL